MEELVNIPALPYFSEGVTKFQGLNAFLVWALITSRIGLGKSGPMFQEVVCSWFSNKSTIQVEEFSRKTSRAKNTVLVP